MECALCRERKRTKKEWKREWMIERKRISEAASENGRTKCLLLPFLTKRQCLIKPVTGHKSNNCLCGGCCRYYYCCCCQCNDVQRCLFFGPKTFFLTLLPLHAPDGFIFPTHTHEHLFLSSRFFFCWVFVGCFHFITCCCSRSEYHSSFLSIHLQFSQSRFCYQTYMTVVGFLSLTQSLSNFMCECGCSPVFFTRFQYLLHRRKHSRSSSSGKTNNCPFYYCVIYVPVGAYLIKLCL